MELFSIRRAMAFPPVTGLQAFIPEDSELPPGSTCPNNRDRARLAIVRPAPRIGLQIQRAKGKQTRRNRTGRAQTLRDTLLVKPFKAVG